MRILSLLVVLFILPASADDFSSFDTPPGTEWQQYDPRAIAGLSPSAVFDFSNGHCRIIAPQPTSEADYYAAGGLARAGLFAPNAFQAGAASVDILEWNATTNRTVNGTFIGVLTRMQDPVGVGSVSCYSASIIDMGENSGPGGIGRNGRLQIMLVQNEFSYTLLNGYDDFPLDPAHDYRLILVSRGTSHVARLVDLSNECLVVSELRATDATLSSGRTGVMILTDRLPTMSHLFIDVTFDNFLAWDGSPPPLLIQPGTTAGTVEISSEFFRSLASDMQSTTDPTQPGTWLAAAPSSAARTGGQRVEVHPLDGPRRFFRRRSL